MPYTRNDEDQTKASPAGTLSISVPALIPLMNKRNNRISRHTNREKGGHVHGVAKAQASIGSCVEQAYTGFCCSYLALPPT